MAFHVWRPQAINLFQLYLSMDFIMLTLAPRAAIFFKNPPDVSSELTQLDVTRVVHSTFLSYMVENKAISV